MNKAITQALHDALPTVTQPPEKLVSYTNVLYSNSVRELPLNQKEEAARTHICAHLAIERYIEKGGNVPKATVKKIPVTERQFSRLMDQFRDKLFEGGTSPTKNKSVPTTPTKGHLVQTPTKARIRTPSSRIQTPKDAEKQFDSQVKNFTPKSGKERFAVKTSPSKRSPTKTAANQPHIDDIYRCCDALQLEESSTQAVEYGYRHYNTQIRDKWLFFGGLICYITKQAHPDIYSNSSRPFTTLVSDLLPPGVTPEKVREWEEQVKQMLGEHSWVKKISKAELGAKSTKRTSEDMLDIIDKDSDWVQNILKKIKTEETVVS